MRLRLLLAFVALGACSRAPPEASSSAKSEPAAAPTAVQEQAAANAASPSQPPLWTDPSAWSKEAPKSSMRVAEYKIPHTKGDTEDAECVVYHFGPDQGGSADDNINRWKGQFSDSTDAKTDTKDVSGMKVTRLEVSGTYSGGMPAPGQAASGPKAHQRMIAAVVEAPAGAYFFKLTGPDATVKAAAPAFDGMIGSLR